MLLLKKSDLKKIGSLRLRNLTRTALFSTKTEQLKKVLSSISKEATAQQAFDVYSTFLEAGAEDTFVPTAFPKTPAEIRGNVAGAPGELAVEIAIQLSRIVKHREQLNEYVIAMSRLSNDVSESNWNSVIKQVKNLIDSHGVSLALFSKCRSLMALKGSEPIRKELDSLIDDWSKPSPTVILASIIDLVDRDDGMISTRRRFMSYIDEGFLKSRNSQALLRYINEGCPTSPEECATTLRGLGIYSLVDVFFFLVQIPEEYIFLPENLNNLVSDLRMFWVDAYDDVKIDKLGSELMVEESIKDFHFLRHLHHWSDVPSVWQYRTKLETSLGHRFSSRISLKMTGSSFSKRGSSATPPNLPTQREDLGEDIITFSDQSYWRNTIVLVENWTDDVLPAKNSRMSFVDALEITVNVAELTTPEEIEALGDGLPSVSKHFDNYVIKTLLDDALDTDQSGFEVRMAAEDLILEEYDGDIISFVENTHVQYPRIAEHFVEKSSELFLSQLFELLETPNEVAEAKAQLLEWQHAIDPEANSLIPSLVKSIRFSSKLQRLKNEVADRRLFVDPDRYSLYLRESVLPMLQRSSDGAMLVIQQAEVNKLKNPVKVIENPSLRFANLLDSAFSEFYTNRHFGLDSYIGRRIRHGTLSLTIESPIVARVNKFIEEYKDTDSKVVSYLNEWLDSYRTIVSDLVNEFLHVKSTTKPDGIFNPSLLGRDVTLWFLTMKSIHEHVETGVRDTSLVPVIINWFWRVAETDIASATKLLSSLKQKSVMQNTVWCSDHLKPEFEKLITAINSEIDAKFAVVAGWLKKPPSSTIEADIDDVFDVVVDDIKDLFPDYRPEIERNTTDPLQLIGFGFTYIYDILFALIGNAAKHGKRNGKLVFRVEKTADNAKSASWKITIESDLISESDMCKIKTAFDEAKAAGLDNPHQVEGGTGIPKVLAELSENFENGDLDILTTPTSCAATVSFELPLV